VVTLLADHLGEELDRQGVQGAAFFYAGELDERVGEGLDAVQGVYSFRVLAVAFDGGAGDPILRREAFGGFSLILRKAMRVRTYCRFLSIKPSSLERVMNFVT